MGCGASASQAVWPKRAGKRASRQHPDADPELQTLLDKHGLSTQMESLQRLGVTKPGHITDLLVTDLEEAGLSRVQIRQLQRDVGRAPAASTSSESPEVSPYGIQRPRFDDVAAPPKESVASRDEEPTCSAAVVLAQSPAECLQPHWQPKSSICGDGSETELEQIPGLGTSIVDQSKPWNADDDDRMGRNAGQATPKEKTPTHQSCGKPPLYKNTFPNPQSPSVSPKQHLSPATAAAGSRPDSRETQGTPPLPHSIGDDEDVVPHSNVGDVEDADLAELESGLEFDVTLLPEVASASLKENLVQHAFAPASPAKAPPRPQAFGAGPQPQVGSNAVAPSAQLPVALRQRLAAREEGLREKRQNRQSERSDESWMERPGPRTRSPPGPGRRSASEGPSVQRAQARGRPASVGAAGRQMFDKNELRAFHRDLFMEAIDKYQAKSPTPVQEPVDGTLLAAGQSQSSARAKPVQVYARKRPLFSEEVAKRNDFDVLHIIPCPGTPSQLVLHNCLFQADLRTPMVHHLRFAFDQVFSQWAEDEEVYKVCAANLVSAARRGQASTVLMFGQTGSGKTHTMRAIETQAAGDLFRGESKLSISFVELRGSRCFDLQVPNLPELKLREVREAAGNFFVAEGAADIFPEDVEAACAALQAARQRRATFVTEANDESSRSHAVCTIKILDTGGSLTLVDCAGTERRKDSANHCRERQHEGAEINASLYALKECIRFMSARQRIPPHAFRASALTKLLARCLSRLNTSFLSVICTLAPAASDTEHTLSTLRTDPHPRQWSPHEVRNWLCQVENGIFADVCAALPAEFTGQMLVRLTEAHCARLCGSPVRGQLLFELLHESIRNSNQPL
eukprot:s351_g10.t1